MIRVAVDAMGGDRGPEEIVAGAVDAASDTVQPVIVGPRGLANGQVEIKNRKTGARENLSPDAVLNKFT